MNEHGRYLQEVPTDLLENIEFRRDMVRAGAEDPTVAEGLKAMCRVDMLFWMNVFGFTYDPRLPESSIPYMTYEFQNEALVQIEEAIGSHDLVIKKSRDMGASWMLLSVFLWRWMWKPGESFLLISRNEDYVDKAGNPKSLFWKLDFLLEHMPDWLKPKFTRTRLRLTNESLRSMIDGESTTGDVARGDRRTACGLDEFAAFDVDAGFRALASTRDATASRIFNSTPSGTGNAFHAVATNTEIDSVELHWSLHPVKSEGLYIQEGKKRSPWYDGECKRCASPSEIAQELDIDFQGSQANFFDLELLSKISIQTVRTPDVCGVLEHEDDGTPIGFVTKRGGPLKMWIRPDATGNVPADRTYAMGVDIAAGTGASNSCISIGDTRTGEKVAEFVTPHLRPDQLGRVCVALAKWFAGSDKQGARLVWESAGPGRIFGNVVVELGYRNIWFKRQEGVLGAKQSHILGWHPSRNSKQSLFGNYRKALFSGNFINRSREALDECRDIIHMPGGGIEHQASVNAIDVSGARMNHGDRATADALLWLVMDAFKSTDPAPELAAEPGSFMFRRLRADEKERKIKEW